MTDEQHGLGEHQLRMLLKFAKEIVFEVVLVILEMVDNSIVSAVVVTCLAIVLALSHLLVDIILVAAAATLTQIEVSDSEIARDVVVNRNDAPSAVRELKAPQAGLQHDCTLRQLSFSRRHVS
jgi:hypothetical protein